MEPLFRALEREAIIAIPTESSYGLAVNPHSEKGVQRILRLKRRRVDNPLPVVAADRAQIEALGGRLDDPVLERLSAIWPAALSLLVPAVGEIPAAAGAGRLAVRVPAHARLRRLLKSLGTALTATSANRSGEPSLTRPDLVQDLLAGQPDSVVVDDGPLGGGNPSTLVGVREGEVEVLRRGAVPIETLAAILGAAGEESFSAASVEIFADESR